jgi:probable rRNA maturation factor
MKIHWDNRSSIDIPKSFYVTLKKAALAALKECFEVNDMKKLKYEVSISFVSDGEIQELNNKYRGKNKPTDVLSFPSAEIPDCGVFCLGDIVISAETAVRQADEYGHSFERETAFLTVHGILHLLGLDHETDTSDEAVMEEIQGKILIDLGLSK